MKENNGMTSQCPQNGRSMIEMLGVLAIIGVLSVGGIMGYSKAMFRYKVNKTIEQITYIAGNIRTTFANQGNFIGLSAECPDNNCIAKKARIVPEDMWKAGENYPQNVWEGEVYFYEYYERKFNIGYDKVPPEACVELLTKLDGNTLRYEEIEVCAEGDDGNIEICSLFPFSANSLENAIDVCYSLETAEGVSTEFDILTIIFSK